MGFYNRLILDIAYKINFKEKYSKLLKKYPKINSFGYILNINKIISLINNMGYKVTYNKKENFFKVFIGNTISNYNIYCYIIIRNNCYFLDAGIYLFDKKKYIGGALLNPLYKELSNQEISKLYFKDNSQLQELINDILKIAEELKQTSLDPPEN